MRPAQLSAFRPARTHPRVRICRIDYGLLARQLVRALRGARSSIAPRDSIGRVGSNDLARDPTPGKKRWDAWYAREGGLGEDGRLGEEGGAGVQATARTSLVALDPEQPRLGHDRSDARVRP